MYNEWNAQMKIVDMLQYFAKEHSRDLYVVDLYYSTYDKPIEWKLNLNGEFHHDYKEIFNNGYKIVQDTKINKYGKINRPLHILDSTYKDSVRYYAEEIQIALYKNESVNWHPWTISLSIINPKYVYQIIDGKKLATNYMPGGYRERYDFSTDKEIDMDLFKYAVELIEDTQEKNISLGKQIIRNCKLAQILSINKEKIND